MATRTGFGGDFYRFLAAQSISSFGSSFTIFALPLLVYELTGSALNLGLVTVAEFLPYLLFGFPIGAAVDKLDRKRIMVLSDLGQTFVIASIPLLHWLGSLPLVWIYAAGFLSSVLWICFNTAEFSAIPSLVKGEDLTAANSYLQGSYSAATVAGPIAAGAVVSLFPITTVFLLDALSFLLSAFLVSRVRVRFAREGDPNRDSGVLAGLRYVWRDPLLRALCLIMAVANGVGYTVYAQLVLFSKEQLGASDAQTGFLYAAGSLGMVVLALLATPLRRRLRFGTITLGALALGGTAIVALAFTTSYWLAALIWALTWGLVVLFTITSNTLYQEVVPDHLLGRVQSTTQVISWSAIPLGALAGSLAIQATGNVSLVYAAIGTTIVLCAGLFSFTALGKSDPEMPQAAASPVQAATPMERE
jgi:MFS family permease